MFSIGGVFNLFKKGRLNDFRVWKQKRNTNNDNIITKAGRNLERIKKSTHLLNGEDKSQLLIQKQQHKNVFNYS